MRASKYMKFWTAVDDPSSRIATLVIALLVTGILYSSLWGQASLGFFFALEQDNLFSNTTMYIHRDDLDWALEGASMENRTVIISVINKAYTEEKGMLYLFLQSLRRGEDTAFLINHLLLTAVDQVAYDRCVLLHLHCYRLVTEGVDFSKEELFMSEDFLKMMWRRTQFLADVLRRGYSFIFTDMDVMWLRNPLPKLSHEGEDMQISCDWYSGLPFAQTSPINTGFYFAAANDKTIALFDKWYSLRNSSEGLKEQDVLAKMITEGVFSEFAMKVRYLDVIYFAGLCTNSGDFEQMRTLHANCCRSVNAKLADLSLVLKEWIKYKKGARKPATGYRWPQRKACNMSWILPLGP